MLNKNRSLIGPVGVMAVSSLLLMGVPLFADTVAERLDYAGAVLSEVMSTPDKGIPKDPLDDAHCIVIVPSVRMEGVSVGWQIGGSETDITMLVMSKSGMATQSMNADNGTAKASILR